MAVVFAGLFALATSISAQTIKIGLNVPLTGDIPKVGEGSKFAAEMWLEDLERHEALLNPAVVRAHRRRPVAAG
jgi:hypothetical protein